MVWCVFHKVILIFSMICVLDHEPNLLHDLCLLDDEADLRHDLRAVDYVTHMPHA